MHSPEAVERLEEALDDAREAAEEAETRCSTMVSARDLTIRDLKAEIEKLKAWQVEAWADKPDEHTAAIEAAFPTRSGSHDEYAIAMQMVGHRHSKRELVALVNWLLVRLKQAE